MLSKVSEIVGLLASIIPLIGLIYVERNELKIRIQSLLKFNKDIRISYAYLYRIKINGKYLLVKGSKILQFQPVGGVFKYFPSSKGEFEKWEVQDDTEEHFYDDCDLRQIIKGKNLYKYIKWFDTRKNREITVVRELIEELEFDIEVMYDIVTNSEIEFIKQIKEPISFSTHFQVDEQKIFEIYEVRLPSKIKFEMFDNEKFIFVDTEDIKKLKYNYKGVSHNLAKTVKYLV